MYIACFVFFFLIDFIFYNSFKFIEHRAESTESSHMPPAPSQLPLLLTSCLSVVINIIIKQDIGMHIYA